MLIRVVKKEDYQAWLDLAREVEPLFGKMVENEDFQNGVKECIANSMALCAVDGNDEVAGIIAVNQAANEIMWLAVREESRGKGYGRRLVDQGLRYLDSHKPVFVQTFAPGAQVGEAARRVYRKFGFKDFQDGGENPAGVATVIMKLDPLSSTEP